MERIRAQYPVYKDVSDADLAIAIGNKFPVYAERDQAFAGEYKHARRKKTLVAQMQQAQAEGDQLDEPSALQSGIEAAAKPALDLPRKLYTSPVALAGEALGVLPEGTTTGLADFAKENIEGMTSLQGVATLPAFGAGRVLAGGVQAVRSPLLRRAAGLAVGGMGAQGVKHGIERIEQAGAEGDPAGVIVGAAEGTVGAVIAGAGYGIARTTFAPLTRGAANAPPVLPIEGNAYIVPGEKGASKQIAASRPGVTLEADATVIESVPTERVSGAQPVPETPAQPAPSTLAQPASATPSRLDALRSEITDLVAQIERARPSDKNALRRKLGPLVIERDALEASGETVPAATPVPAPDVPRGTLSIDPSELVKMRRFDDTMRRHDAWKRAGSPPDWPGFAEDASPLAQSTTPVDDISGALALDAAVKEPGAPPDAPPDTPATPGTPVPVKPKPPTPAPSDAALPTAPREPAPVPPLVQPIIDLASKTPGEALLPEPLPADAIDTAVRESVAEAKAVASVQPAVSEPIAPLPAELTPKQRFAARMAAGKAAAKARRTGTPPPASPSSQAMGITPFMLPDAADIAAMRDALKRFFGRFYRRSTTGTPKYPINIDTTSLLPDPMPWEVREQIATEPTAFGRIPIAGAVLDPRAVNLLPEERVMHTHLHDRIVGKSTSLLAIELHRGETEAPFVFDPVTDEMLNIQPVPGRLDRHGFPLSRYPADFAEEMQRDPTSYVLSPEQRTAFDTAMRIYHAGGQLAERYGIDPQSRLDIIDVNGEPMLSMSKRKGKRTLDFHWPRVAAGKEGVLEPSLPGIAGVFVSSSKPSHLKERLYKTQQLGVQGGMDYVKGFEKPLYVYINSIYRAIYEAQAAEQLAKLGERAGSPERRSRLLTEHRGALARGEMDYKVFEKLVRKASMSEAIIPTPLLRKYIFSDQVAATIDKYRSKDIPRTIQAIDQSGNLLKTLSLGYDLGYATIQMMGLLTAPNGRAAFARVMYNSMRSIVEEDRMHVILQQDRYLTAMREMAQLGHPFGTLPDIQRGLAAGQLLTRLPGMAGKFTRGMARAFQIALDFSAAELWLTYRDITPRERWAEVAEMVGNLTMRGRMEGIGVRPERAFFERALFNAPSYYRGAINVLAGALQDPRFTFDGTGSAGKVARRGLTGIIGAGLLMFYGLAKLVQLSNEEIKRRLDPGSGDFAMVPVNLGDGKIRNIGLGGPIKSFMRLYGETYDAAVRDPRLLMDPTIGDRNPITRWFRARMAPWPSIIWDITSEEDFLGRDMNMAQLLKNRMPIGAQEWPSFWDMALTMLGFSVFDENQRAAAFRHRSEAAQALHGKRYEDLDVGQQFDISSAFKGEFEAAKGRTAAERTKIVTLASESSVKRAVELSEALPEAVRKRMTELHVDTTGYDPKVTRGQPGHTREMMLTPRQLKRYGELISEEYNKVLPKRVFDPGLAELAPDKRQDSLNETMARAKTRAKRRLFEEINAHAAATPSTLSTNIAMPTSGSNLLSAPMNFDLTKPAPARGVAPTR